MNSPTFSPKILESKEKATTTGGRKKERKKERNAHRKNPDLNPT